MKKVLFLLIMLASVSLHAQHRLTGTVANWTPATAKDSIFKSNMYLTDDYILGLSYDCEGCDSVWLKLMWSNDAPDSTYFRAPLYQNGSAVDSIYVNGDAQGGVYATETPFPYNAVYLNQVGGTKLQKIVIKRTITTKHR